ncbi:MAG: pyrroline-5-carboxylate reductase [Treponema sp.]|jgi:pyrroline-5-carboxylate reductase|nr:pyrroline-5-carboxylate reductase [Treponema sp.]
MSVISCIGSGNMGFALMKGASNSAPGMKIIFTDTEIEKAMNAADSLGAEIAKTNIEAVKKCDYIFLAVKPQILPLVFAEIAGVIGERIGSGLSPVIVSMAAGWSIEKIQTVIGHKMPVVRILPNTPALIGKGMTAFVSSPEVPAEKKSELKKILAGTGIVDQIDESLMDAVTGLSGSGPAFVYLFLEALADGGVLAGLPRNKALLYAAQTVIGAAAMVQKTGKLPGELKDMVTSPGGTTIAGIAALENGAFRGTVIKAVEAAWQRAKELG